MPSLALALARTLPWQGGNTGAAAAESAPSTAAAAAEILQRNMPAAEIPDPRYWTAYDYYMIEREARAMRTVQMHALLGKGWRALTRRPLG